MDFIQILSGDVKEGKMRDLQAWLSANEETMAAETPDGIDYLGTYVSVYSSEKGMGQLFTLVRMSSYGAQDRLAGAGGEYARLISELVDFVDQSNSANTGQILLKRLTDATLWGSD